MDIFRLLFFAAEVFESYVLVDEVSCALFFLRCVERCAWSGCGWKKGSAWDVFVDIFKCEESLFECEDCLNAWRRHVNESLFEFLIGRL